MNTVRMKPLLVVAFFNETAYSMMWPLATIYINQVLHKSLTVAGLALFGFAVANVIGAVVSGKLYDRFNQFWLTVIGLVLCILSSGVGIKYDGWPTYALILIAFGFATGWLTTGVNVYGTLVAGRSATHVFNEIYLVLNVGLVIGTICISELFHRSIAPIFLLVTCLYCISLMILSLYFPKQRLYYAATQRPSVEQSSSATQPTSKLASWPLFVVSLATLVIVWTMYSQWESNFSVYLIDNGFSTRVYSMLWTLNGVVIILVQLLIAHWPNIIHNLFDRVSWGLFFLTVSYFVTISSKSLVFIFAGMILLTIGEAIYVPSVPVIIDNWSANEVKGRNQGLVNGFSSVGRAIGPLFGGLIIDHFSFPMLFIVAGVLMLGISGLNWLVNLSYRKEE